MKLRIALLPLAVFAVFGYSVSVVDRVSEHGAVKLTVPAIVKQIKEDAAKFEPSTVFVYNT